MLNFIDNFLNRITMYRLALYYLLFLLLAAVGLSIFKILPFSPLGLLFSGLTLVIVSAAVNKAIAYFLKVPANVESVYITALILTLIISPPKAIAIFATLPFLLWAGIWANASKYIVNIKHKHIFNPAAFAVALTAISLNQSASWWIGTPAMLPFVLVGGFLLVKKVQRFDAVIAFIIIAVTAVVVFSPSHGNLMGTFRQALLYSPLFFFAAVMLTEPLTMPPTQDGRMAYGVLVGWLFAPQTHIGTFYFTPELALLAGNIFSYVISPKGRYVLTLKEIKKAGSEVYDFIFQNDRLFNFRPGQYMEWTLAHARTDSRGNRRYFTLASSPTERNTLLGVKFYANPSSYKNHLKNMRLGDTIIASQLAGDFTLPKDPGKKLVFVAGGIGVTPFRSMLKYLLDNNEQRDIALLYSNRTIDEVVYTDVLDQAQDKFGIKTVYTLTDQKQIPAQWQGYRGHFNADIIAKEIPDFRERAFYISGSGVFVRAFKDVLLGMGISRNKIVTDFFPGLA
jgi:glycine betaine catabolism B